MVLLAGNYHTRLEKDAGDPEFTPMGYHLSNIGNDSIDRSKILSMLGRSSAGSNWACYSSKAEECGIKRFQNGAPNYSSAKDWNRFFLIEPALRNGNDATLFVRTTSASVPLQSAIQLGLVQ